MRWVAAWESEPPLLMQCRDLLARLVVDVNAAMGNKVDLHQLVPCRNQPEIDRDFAIQDMTLFFEKHNATIQ